MRGGLEGEFEAGFLRGAVDGQHLIAEVGQLRDEVEGWGKDVAVTVQGEHAVVFQVVVTVVDEQVEEQAAVELFQVGLGALAEAADDAGEVDVAAGAGFIGNVEQGAGG